MSGQLGNTDPLRGGCIGSGSGLNAIRDEGHASPFAEGRQQNIPHPIQRTHRNSHIKALRRV